MSEFKFVIWSYESLLASLLMAFFTAMIFSIFIGLELLSLIFWIVVACLSYITLAIRIKRLVIKDNHVEVFRPLLVFYFFKVYIPMNAIVQVNYRNRGAKTNPRIQIRKQSHFPLTWSNYVSRSFLDFEERDFDKVKKIIQFFKSQNIKTQVITETGEIP